ncbi:MAG: AraC family transcriptional regulator [Verrucomicrobiota bacterium]
MISPKNDPSFFDSSEHLSSFSLDGFSKNSAPLQEIHCTLLYLADLLMAPVSSQMHFTPGTCVAWRLKRGQAKLWFEDKEFTLEPESWFIMPSPPRVYEFTRESRLLSIHFQIENTELNTTTPIQLRSHFRIDAIKNPKFDSLFTQIKNGLTDSSLKEESTNLSKTPLVQWGIEILRHYQQAANINILLEPEDSRVLEAIKLIENEPIDQKINMNKISHECGLSQVQMNRLFRNAYAMTLKQYHDRRRFYYARERLSKNNTRIKEVAFHLGFRHLSAFSQWFRNHEGRSPRDYKQLFS